MQFNDKQLAAIKFCTDTNRRIVAISGEAGTGKTTIIQRAVEVLKGKGRSVVLSAPTGRAARRISEATGYNAITVHKLLEYGRPNIDENTGEPTETTGPNRTRERPLTYSDVIVDEFMMVNEELYRNLVDALPRGARLLAFGDVAQLPPIEEYEIKTVDGAPFERLLKMPASVILTDVYRQDELSGILSNARLIRAGKPPKRKDDFIIDVTEYPILALRKYIQRAKEELDIDYSELENQVISPARRGPLGVHSLNTVMQALFRAYDPEVDSIDLPREKWMEAHPATVGIGEKVICNENIYDLRDFFDRFTRFKDDNTDDPDWTSYIPPPDNCWCLNGEIGIVTDILPDGGLDIKFTDRTVHFPSSYRDYIARFSRVVVRDPRRKLDLAYAVTTHKMQGSECDHVCLVLHSAISPNINRNNIYTAVTRAKKSVYYITDRRQLMNGVRLTSQEKQKLRKATQKGFKIGDTSRD